MKVLDPVARVLAELIDSGAVTRSTFGARAKIALAPLFESGALREVRSGAGWKVCVENSAALERFSLTHFPKGLESGGGKLGRAAAVATLRNAKRGKNYTGEPILIRGFSKAFLKSNQGKIDLQKTTQLCGTASFVLSDRMSWSYAGKRVALVENLEPFLCFEEQFKDFDAVIYAAGRASDSLLFWLEKEVFEIVHFGDYDPVGLQEFLRLKNRCGERASLFVPSNIRELVRRYGRSKLLRDSSAIFSSLRTETDADVVQVLQYLEEFGLGLEQEILWAGGEE